jgi:hypothetical protein
MAKKRATTGLDGRHRDRDGEIRHKRGDTLVGTLREAYGNDFAKGYRSDTKLSTVLKSTGSETLSEYLEHSKRGSMLVGTLRQEYGRTFAKGRRSDAKLSTVLKSTGSEISNTVFSRITEKFEPALKSLAKK